MTTTEWGPADWQTIAYVFGALVFAFIGLLVWFTDGWRDFKDSLRRLPPSDPANWRPYELEAGSCDHDWQYRPDDPDKPRYTGYIEECSKCHAIQQIPQ